MMLDAGELISMIPENGISGSKNSDTIISFYKMIETEKKDIIGKYPDMENDINNIKPLFMRMVENSEKGEFYISVYGDFKNSDALNSAFVSMNKMAQHAEQTSDKIPGSKDNVLAWLSNFPQYNWDGKTMSRTATEIAEHPIDDADEETTPDRESFLNFESLFEQGKMKVKYHFPKKVQSTNDPNALFSQDGKTVILEYPGAILAKSPEKANIEIKLDK